jgi:hypothetical protein
MLNRMIWVLRTSSRPSLPDAPRREAHKPFWHLDLSQLTSSQSHDHELARRIGKSRKDLWHPGAHRTARYPCSAWASRGTSRRTRSSTEATFIQPRKANNTHPGLLRVSVFSNRRHPTRDKLGKRSGRKMIYSAVSIDQKVNVIIVGVTWRSRHR